LPKSHREAELAWLKASDEALVSIHKSMEKTGEWARYESEPYFREKYGKPPMENFDPEHALKLEVEAGEATKASDLAQARVRQARQLMDWAEEQANLTLLPWYPEAPSAPPSAPVSSGGAPGGALQTGTVGVAGTLRGFPPPPNP
jgi:hypothetical protein